MIIPADSKREATFNLRIGSLKVWIFQGTSRQYSFLRIIKGNGEEFVPVADEIVLYHDFVKSQFPLSKLKLASD